MYVKAGQKLVSLISIFSPWLIFLHVFCLSRTPSSPLMFLWMFLHVKCNNTRHQVKNRFDNNGVYEVTHYVISDGMRIFHLFTEKLMLHYVPHTLPVKVQLGEVFKESKKSWNCKGCVGSRLLPRTRQRAVGPSHVVFKIQWKLDLADTSSVKRKTAA